MKLTAKLTALLLCTAMLLGTVLAAEADTVDQRIADAAAGLSALGGTQGTLLKDQELFPAGISGCDWTAIALALAGSEEYYAEYLDALEGYVEDAYTKKGCLDKNKATEYHRIALTVLSLGGDPTAFGKKPDGTVIDLIAEGTYNYIGESLGTQGLNGWIWALIALDAAGTEIPAGAKYQRSDIAQAIVNAQEADGGFGLISGSSDVDITAMALQALAPYRDAYPEVIEAALNYLSGKMTDTCGYISYGEENAESAAQVVLALTALGIDPEKDERFLRNGNTLLMELGRFVQGDGTYGHLLTDDKGDYLATSQTMFALVSVQRLRNGQQWIFHFENYEGPNQKETGNTTMYAVIGIGVVAVCAFAGAVIPRKRKRHG